MAETKAAARWAKRVKRLERSGVSLRTFAAREGLKAGSLSFWKWKLGQARGRRGLATPATPMKFIELTAEAAGTPPVRPPAFEVGLRTGRSVRVAAGFDAAELARLLVVLEEARS
jgi:hypothetical protein